jgi:thioredoxin-related protein
MHIVSSVLVTSALAALAPFASSQEPKPAAAPKAEPQVYDEAADARQVVAAAIAKAHKENQRVLIQWGANWCGWCKWLAGTMKSDKDLSHELRYEYQLVHVDVGHFDKHMDLAKELGAKFESIPFLTMLDGDGKPLVQQNTEPFEAEIDGKKGHDPKKVLAFLVEHQCKPLVADAVLAAGLAAAAKDGKRVFLHFGAPWCIWCHRLEDWMARPEIATVLGKEFVDVKIDTDRMTGGEKLYEQQLGTAGVKAEGIPWFAFLDAEGKQLANANGPGGNVGFPQQDDEVAHFVVMLKTARQHLTDDDIAFLEQSLLDVRARREAERKAR